MNASLKRQQGLTFISLIFVLGLLAFLVMLVLKIGPVYLDHSKVVSALTALEKMPEVETKSDAEIRGILNKRFSMNYVNDVTDDDIKVIQSGTYLKVIIQYNVIKQILGNLSVLVEFNNEIEVGE